MNNKKYVLNELSGTLFPEKNCTVIYKGKIKIDGIEQYASIIKYTNPVGEDKLELSISAGLLRTNPEEEKYDPIKSPDIYGKITFNGRPLKFGLYHKVSDSGVEWNKVLLQENEKEEETKNDAPF